MVSTQFGSLLKELEVFFQCPLEPDSNNSCLIKMGKGLSIQLELDRYGLLLVGCRIATLSLGRHRDNIIHAALKFNASTTPFTGVFGYSQKFQQLILFTKLNPQLLTIHQIISALPPFIDKAKKWREAMAKNEIPTTGAQISSSQPSGIFGLIS